MTSESAAPAKARDAAVAVGRPSRQELMIEATRLYETYAGPLEPHHWGRFVAVSPDGRTVVGDDLESVSRESAATIGRGSFLFKIGQVVVGRIR